MVRLHHPLTTTPIETLQCIRTRFAISPTIPIAFPSLKLLLQEVTHLKASLEGGEGRGFLVRDGQDDLLLAQYPCFTRCVFNGFDAFVRQ